MRVVLAIVFASVVAAAALWATVFHAEAGSRGLIASHAGLIDN